MTEYEYAIKIEREGWPTSYRRLEPHLVLSLHAGDWRLGFHETLVRRPVNPWEEVL